MKYSDGYLDPSKETRWQTEMLFASNVLRQIQQAKKTALVSVSHCTVEPSWRFYLTLFVYMLYIYKYGSNALACGSFNHRTQMKVEVEHC